jgi:kynurenine formamidase
MMEMSMTRRFIDLSLPIEEGPSERIAVSVEYYDHQFGAQQMEEIFSVPARELPEGLGWAGERVTLITHAGTHMDAPYHYGPLCAGQQAKSIDEIPLDWCTGDGVVLDMRHKQDGEEISAFDLQLALSQIKHQLQPGEIVLIHTGADRYWGDESYPERGSGLTRESTLWLVSQGIKIIGIDAWGFDRPFSKMREAYQRTGDVSYIWPAHFAGREQEYLQLEKLANLDQLPPRCFKVYCFPIKVKRASAAWCRVVAELNN